MVSRTIEVDLSDFDPDDIMAEAREIAARRGLSDFDLGEGLLADLAADIANGHTDSALLLLDRLFAADTKARHAIEIGRRRKL